MNDALAGKVFPTIRYVLELVDRRTTQGAEPSPADLSQLRKLLSQFDISGPDRSANMLAHDALLCWIDATLLVNGSGREGPGIGAPATSLAQLVTGSGQSGSSDAAETLYWCAALGMADQIAADGKPAGSIAPEQARRRLEEWSRATYLRIAPKPPDVFSAYATPSSFDPDADALPLAGERTVARSNKLLIAATALFAVAVAAWAWLRFAN